MSSSPPSCFIFFVSVSRKIALKRWREFLHSSNTLSEMYNCFYSGAFAVLSVMARDGVETSFDKFCCQKVFAAASGCEA